jgi:hypothetical protein
LNIIPKFHSVRTVVTLAAALSTLHAQSSSDPTARSAGILQDYIYGFSPVAMEAARAVQTAVPDNITVPGIAPINQFGYRTTLADPAETFIIRPNADTLYTNAWLDLACEPIILHVPDTAGRYYLVPMLDAYSNEFASIGVRTTGTGAGDYAIVGPNWRGPLPEPVSSVVHAPTNTVWMIGRTLVRGQADLSAAVAVSKQFLLIPLSAYPDFLQTGTYTPPAGVPVTTPNPDFKGRPVTSSPGFSKPEFFDVLAAYSLRNPPPRDQVGQASELVLNGFLHQRQLNSDVAAQANQAFAREGQAVGTNENGWIVDLKGGNYGTDYLLRATLTRLGFGTNIAEDAIYPSAMKDIDGNPLAGANSYVIHFAPGQTPPARGFWSITVYDQDGFLVPNSIQRYDVGSETGLTPNADGSIDIFVQSTPPATMESNWLPTPAGPFELTMRLFWPDQSALSGAWMPPPITPVNAAMQ